MDTKKLRQKILDLAIRGKLVPQDPNDEPASVLLERIRAEKQQLIKEGKIKAPRASKASDTSHYGNDNPPFDIPEGWVWCKVEDIAYFGGGKTPSMACKEYWNNCTTLWVTSKDMKYDRISDSLMKISDSALEDMQLYSPGTLLMVTRSGILKRTLPLAILDRYATVNQDIKTISVLNPCLPEYVFYAIRSNELKILKEYHKDGTTVDSINFDKFISLDLPLPPLGEQKRIINEVEKWMRAVESIESSHFVLNETILTTKSRILSLAISGKLVPQDPTDEPAIDLLKRINPDFVPCDNSHYENDIPEGWCLAHLGDVAEYGDTRNVDVSSISQDDWVLELEDIEKDTATIVCRKAKVEREINGVRHSFKKGQILYSKLRTYLNKVLIAPEDGFCTTEIVPITAGKAVVPEYLLIVLRSPYFLEYTASCGYGVKMPRLGTTDAKKAVIPVPPLAEQKRIVQKVSELMEVITSF